MGFANFYQQFIQGFSRLAAPLTFILKTAPAISPAASAEVEDEEQDSKKI